MAKTIELPEMTEKQEEWLKTVLSDASADALGSASNNHIWAMGAKTQKECVEYEHLSVEQREFAQILLNIAAKI